MVHLHRMDDPAWLEQQRQIALVTKEIVALKRIARNVKVHDRKYPSSRCAVCVRKALKITLKRELELLGIHPAANLDRVLDQDGDNNRQRLHMGVRFAKSFLNLGNTLAQFIDFRHWPLHRLFEHSDGKGGAARGATPGRAETEE